MIGLIAQRRNAIVLFAVLTAFVLVATGVGQLGSAVTQRVVTVGLVYVVAVVGLYIFAGNSGIFSFGHVGFVAGGAYLGALLTMTPSEKLTALPQLPTFLASAHMAPLAAWCVSGLGASAIALVVGIPVMRLVGIAAAIGTFAFLVITNVVTSNWTAVTGGSAGLTAVPVTTHTVPALIWAVVAIGAAILFQESKTGLRLRASRDEHVAARACGIGVVGERRAAFVISAFFAGVAGALYGGFVGSFTPGTFYLDLTFLLVSMLVVGGSFSATGAVLGTVVMVVLSELLRHLEEGVTIGAGLHIPGRPGEQQLILSAVLLGILLLRPRGLSNGVEWDLSALVRLRRGRDRHDHETGLRTSTRRAGAWDD